MTSEKAGANAEPKAASAGDGKAKDEFHDAGQGSPGAEEAAKGAGYRPPHPTESDSDYDSSIDSDSDGDSDAGEGNGDEPDVVASIQDLADMLLSPQEPNSPNSEEGPGESPSPLEGQERVRDRAMITVADWGTTADHIGKGSCEKATNVNFIHSKSLRE